MKAVKKYIARFFGQLSKAFGEAEIQEIVLLQPEPRQAIEQESEEITPIVELKKQDEKEIKKKTNSRLKKQRKGGAVTVTLDPRDIMETMEFPFLALSKKRTDPIIYESKDGKTKIQISAHRGHYVASIYDWDIIQLISGKIQEVINSKCDIPPRTLIIPRHELLRSIHRHNGKKQERDLNASLTRLKTTVIETSVRNEDRKYDCFGWLDSWGYTERKDIKEIRITLSQWLYDGICRKGSLLKVSQGYFDLTSGLKKFLYRTARKHVGNHNQSWDFLIETLHEKSGSEQIFKCFKRDLKKAVSDNDIPDYFLEWIEKDGKEFVRFINKIENSKEQQKIAKKIVKNQVNKVVSDLKMPSKFKT